MACVGTATRSAHAASGRSPTTRAPTRGPEPSAAARSTSPARSQPGRQPAAAIPASLTSPRLREIARTRTIASPRSGTGAATGLMTSRPGASGSTTTARLSLTDHLHSRSALPSRPCCAELRHDLLGEPAELLEHHRLRRAHADAHVDVLEPREPGLEVLEVSDELLGRAGEPRARLHVVLDGGDAGGAPAATTRRRLALTMGCQHSTGRWTGRGTSVSSRSS